MTARLFRLDDFDSPRAAEPEPEAVLDFEAQITAARDEGYARGLPTAQHGRLRRGDYKLNDCRLDWLRPCRMRKLRCKPRALRQRLTCSI